MGMAAVTGAVFTDELTTNSANSDDQRAVSDDNSSLYTALQNARNDAQFARAAMRKYAPDDTVAIGQLYANEAYADVLLAEFMCSGVPLSTIDFQRDFTYRAGSPSAEIYAQSGALFDSAAMFAKDSVGLLTLARVGKGRTLLQRGDFAGAAQAVAQVPTSSVYQMRIGVSFGLYTPYTVFDLQAGATMGNHDGTNGLPFATVFDPRAWPDSTERYITLPGAGGPSLYLFHYPAQYTDALNTDTVAIALASGVEARLIEAEAALHTNPSSAQWLNILNDLRTDGSFTVTTRTATPGVSPGPFGFPDTTWGPGSGVGFIPASVVADAGPQCEPADPNTGITPPCTDVDWYRGLGLLDDPGASLSGQAAVDARVDLLFEERAFWLYLTGHRQGDLRRLVRGTAAGGYGRPQQNVYPSGLYRGGSPYGTAVVFPVPRTERANPYFTGCLSLGA